MRSLAMLIAFASACTSGGAMPDASVGRDAGLERCETEDATRCAGAGHERCVGGRWVRQQACDIACDPLLGCVDCVPALRRTCIANHVRACTDEGLIGAVLETCAADAPCSDGYCGGCAASTELVYLLDAGAHLFSFDPRTLALNDLGAIDCQTQAQANPYSMAVDRRGQAWVLFDSGELFWVDVADASCRPSGFVPDQDDFHTFGMGFVAESRGGAETLYVAGGPSLETALEETRLATLDLVTLEVRPIGSLTVLDDFYPELTGDGAGGLFGYFPSTRFPSRISTVRRDTARIGPTWDVIEIDQGTSVQAWAFARWGGDFYVFLSIGGLGMPGNGSEIYRLDPETSELTLLRYDFHTFVGAGVSTCAPLLF